MEPAAEGKVMGHASGGDMTHIPRELPTHVTIGNGLLEPEVEGTIVQLGQEMVEERMEQMVSEGLSQMVEREMVGGVMEQISNGITNIIKKEEELENEVRCNTQGHIHWECYFLHVLC